MERSTNPPYFEWENSLFNNGNFRNSKLLIYQRVPHNLRFLSWKWCKHLENGLIWWFVLGHLQIGLKTMTWISVTWYAQCHKPSIWGYIYIYMYIYIQPIKMMMLRIVYFWVYHTEHHTWGSIHGQINQQMEFSHKNLDRTMKHTDFSINHIKKKWDPSGLISVD